MSRSVRIVENHDNEKIFSYFDVIEYDKQTNLKIEALFKNQKNSFSDVKIL